jgi:hypothetical protein
MASFGTIGKRLKGDSPAAPEASLPRSAEGSFSCGGVCWNEERTSALAANDLGDATVEPVPEPASAGGIVHATDFGSDRCMTAGALVTPI